MRKHKSGYFILFNNTTKGRRQCQLAYDTRAENFMLCGKARVLNIFIEGTSNDDPARPGRPEDSAPQASAHLGRSGTVSVAPVARLKRPPSTEADESSSTGQPDEKRSRVGCHDPSHFQQQQRADPAEAFDSVVILQRKYSRRQV